MALDVSGRWLSKEGKCVATIENDIISWTNGPFAKLDRCSHSEFSVVVPEVGKYSARLCDNGELAWSDGDTWVQQRQSKISQRRQASSWQSCAGSGGASASASGREERRNSKMKRLGICGSSLLPDRAVNMPPKCPSMALLAGMASSPYDGCRYSANFDENTVARVLLVASDPSYMVIELNALTTYNMMDCLLSADLDWAKDMALTHMERSSSTGVTPIGIVCQGSGPHFCPGGNPRGGEIIARMPGFSQWDVCQYVGYHPFVRIREFGIPMVAASHGSQVGGGVAYALNSTKRCCAHNTSISYGNLSRGAVPGMMLSANVARLLELGPSLSLYLTDGTFSAWGAVKGGAFSGIAQAAQGSKALGVRLLKGLSIGPGKKNIIQLQNFVSVEKFCDEGHGINMVAKQGILFQSVDAEAKSKYEAANAESKATQGQNQQDKKLRPRPTGMPGRLPGQHLKGLRAGEQAVCAQCGNVSSSGVWGQEQTEFDGMFFCTKCWIAADEKKSSQKKVKKKTKPADVYIPTTLPERAAALHGASVDGGILSWASYTSTCCATCMHPEPKYAGDQGGRQRYFSTTCKERHENVYKHILATTWAPSDQAARRIEVRQVVEACSFVFWRERSYSTGVVEVKEAVPFDKLDEFDARRALQNEPRAHLREAELALLVIEQGEHSGKALFFDDPKARLGVSENIWWQFVSTESSRASTALVLSSLLACISTPGVTLVLDGKEVDEFGVCDGEYVGPVKPLAIEDTSRGNVFAVPRRLPGGKLCEHNWTYVRAQGGDEYCIDLSAAQFGDNSRGENGCPMKFLPKKEFASQYLERNHDSDPIEAYRDIFQSMLEEKKEETKRMDRPWYKKVNDLEVFVFISGKVCSLLGLV